jgi:hypothetical protein
MLLLEPGVQAKRYVQNATGPDVAMATAARTAAGLAKSLKELAVPEDVFSVTETGAA